MGSNLYQEPHEHAKIKDFSVIIEDSTLVYPPRLETQNKSTFLSNIDQWMNYHFTAVHFFPANPNFPFETVVSRLKKALEKVLVPYDFLAGRLKLNQQVGRLEIECNASGVGFAVATTTDCSLDELIHMVYPNPPCEKLIVPGVDKFDDQPLCVFQVTSFKCGSFAMGMSVNHAVFDGRGYKIFLENLASQAFDDKPLVVVPCNNRRLLVARSPPRVTISHPEFLKPDELPKGDIEIPKDPKSVPKEEGPLVKVLHLSSKNISYLKDKAKGGQHKPSTKISSFNVVVAHIWRCLALSSNAENNRDRNVELGYAVDIRPKMEPQLPVSYCGNGVLCAYTLSKCSALEDEPFSKLVELIYESSTKMTNEYVRSVIDYAEVYKVFPKDVLPISPWWGLGLEEVEYPWGRGSYVLPVVFPKRNIVVLLPEFGGTRNKGMSVIVALPPKEIEKFQFLFYEFLVGKGSHANL